jgi:hypothetical protein
LEHPLVVLRLQGCHVVWFATRVHDTTSSPDSVERCHPAWSLAVWCDYALQSPWLPSFTCLMQSLLCAEDASSVRGLCLFCPMIVGADCYFGRPPTSPPFVHRRLGAAFHVSRSALAMLLSPETFPICVHVIQICKLGSCTFTEPTVRHRHFLLRTPHGSCRNRCLSPSGTRRPRGIR